jgi:hypothetical protein
MEVLIREMMGAYNDGRSLASPEPSTKRNNTGTGERLTEYGLVFYEMVEYSVKRISKLAVEAYTNGILTSSKCKYRLP